MNSGKSKVRVISHCRWEVIGEYFMLNELEAGGEECFSRIQSGRKVAGVIRSL